MAIRCLGMAIRGSTKPPCILYNFFSPGRNSMGFCPFLKGIHSPTKVTNHFIACVVPSATHTTKHSLPPSFLPSFLHQHFYSVFYFVFFFLFFFYFSLQNFRNITRIVHFSSTPYALTHQSLDSDTFVFCLCWYNFLA